MEGRSGGQLELVSPFARGFYLTDPVAKQTWYVGIVRERLGPAASVHWPQSASDSRPGTSQPYTPAYCPRVTAAEAVAEQCAPVPVGARVGL